jgi:Domain of unknown function (DUF4386)
MNKKERIAGLIAGISLVVMAIAAGFSYGYVQNELLNESAEITRQNLIENKSLFFAGLMSWIVILITDLIVSGALFILFRNSMRKISALTAIIRIIYTAIFGIAIWQQIDIIPLLQRSETSIEIHSQFETFTKIWSTGLIIFGFHLLGLGYLSLKSKFIPGFLAWLLYFAGISYVLINLAKQLALLSQPIIASTENILALPMALGELLLAGWLIYKGMKRVKSQ